MHLGFIVSCLSVDESGNSSTAIAKISDTKNLLRAGASASFYNVHKSGVICNAAACVGDKIKIRIYALCTKDGFAPKTVTVREAKEGIFVKADSCDKYGGRRRRYRKS